MKNRITKKEIFYLISMFVILGIVVAIFIVRNLFNGLYSGSYSHCNEKYVRIIPDNTVSKSDSDISIFYSPISKILTENNNKREKLIVASSDKDKNIAVLIRENLDAKMENLLIPNTNIRLSGNIKFLGIRNGNYYYDISLTQNDKVGFTYFVQKNYNAGNDKFTILKVSDFNGIKIIFIILNY